MPNKLRTLTFEDLPAAVEEAKALLRCGYQQRGNWTLGQICRHLRLVQDASIDGYPWWMSLFSPLRPIFRQLMLKRILAGDSPRGVRTAGMFVPPANLVDSVEVDAFEESVTRIIAHEGSFHPHPGFGQLGREGIIQVHQLHAAHHLRFLEPADSSP
ncbi:DUF1569 domain-containing protein [Calycomorphotria hydatis]|uniref:DUF1569 domain-containing protein n=1 Tax=Calycomorphotria hydatis TaxID=2528027 RepID=A0A517TF79_9PLAN|nr:DUF1569 domain-containing protein [Calycomorphotria hydatis]QDT67029.1 hypothetical protein V22_43010 [Calycomorphotria hydatis]